MTPFEPMSHAVYSVGSESVVQCGGPFAGLVICVTGLSKEARKQVMEATERLGGQYSPHLHPKCTHLVVQSFGGRKFEHALKHGLRNDLFVVALSWFVDSVGRNARLIESVYTVNDVVKNGMEESHSKSSDRVSNRSLNSTLSGHSMYIDPSISVDMRNKVVEAATKEGATFLERWFVGCGASHVVCEGSSASRYLRNSNNLVTPLWVLKTAKEKYLQRLVHTSADLARQIGTRLEDLQSNNAESRMDEDYGHEPAKCSKGESSLEERQRKVNQAKLEVRNRRGRRMQTCQTPIRPINPSSLLDSICWSISEPTSTATIYTNSFSCEDGSEHQTPDAKGDGKDSDASFTNFTRSLAESEKNALIFKDHFLTVLFPVDRFAEMGPSSRTFFSDKGFTCLQVLDYIYAFYQENMSTDEIEAAIHTDSRHADRLRLFYRRKETAEDEYASFKRVNFLGSRKSFEMLKRVTGDNNNNVYELLVRA